MGIAVAGHLESQFDLTELDSRLTFVQKSPLPPFLKKGGNRKSPFVKGDLEGFSFAQRDFDETLTAVELNLNRACEV